MLEVFIFATNCMTFLFKQARVNRI